MPDRSPRLDPLKREDAPELEEFFRTFERRMGFVPNSVLTMARRPKVVRALAALGKAVYDVEGGVVPMGLKSMVAELSSRSTGCLYCQAHTLLGAKNFNVSEEKLAAVWTYASSPLYTERERVALDFALAAASQPNAVTDEGFAALRAHWSDSEIVEILGVVAMFGFLNRWNDSMATPLEAVPLKVAQDAAGERGWEAGKHGAA